MITQIFIENELIDLFKDETIELNSSVANTEDISKVNTDYTKTFTVPASDNNNRIFKHYYNADIDNTFDARTKKNARIEIDGFPFRTGKMRLEKVQVKRGRPSSYTINFWGNLVNFKTLIKDDKLSSLDLSDYNHPYTSPFVILGLELGMNSGDIIYTLMNQNRQYMYSSDPGNNTNTDKLVNIAYNGEERGVRWNELKPSIRLLAIIEAIESKYGITFSRDFFNRDEFKQLYLWLNNSATQNYTEQLINWTSGDATEYGLNLTTDKWVINNYSSSVVTIKYRIGIIPESGYENVPYKILAKNGDIVILNQEATGEFHTDFLDPSDPPFNIGFYVSSQTTFSYTANLTFKIFLRIGGSFEKYAQAEANTITDIFEPAQAMPDMKIIDFLKGLFNMFKLVAIPDEFDNVYVNNIDDYYIQGKIYDITEWVNTEKYDVERGKIFNTINFKYQEPTTLLNMQFKKNTGLAYGDEALSLADENGVPLDGDSLDISLPFEIVLFERLRDIETNFDTRIQYGLITNDTIEPVNPKAVIFYNNNVDISTSPVSLLQEGDDVHNLNGVLNTPGNELNLDSPVSSILWGVEYSTWNGAAIVNTLFKRFWSNYIASIFNIKRRNFKFSAKLPVSLLTKLQLNDVLFIKDRYYRLNDFTINLTNGDTTLNLMNSFENNFGLFSPAQDKVFLNSLAQTISIYVTNGSVMNIVKEDLGAGTTWATVTKSGFNLNISVTDNAGIEREMFINVDNGSGKSFQIYLNQAEA